MESLIFIGTYFYLLLYQSKNLIELAIKPSFYKQIRKIHKSLVGPKGYIERCELKVKISKIQVEISESSWSNFKNKLF